MKYLLLITGIFLCQYSKAQVSALGKKENQIKIYMATSGYVFQDSSIVSKYGNTVVTLEYHPNDSDTTGDIPIGYTFKNDTCVTFMFHSYLKDLPNIIKAMDKKYKRIDDTNWLDENATHEAILWKDDKGFYMCFQKL